MARKFTMGRQSEHLLNEDLHRLFMTMKYLHHGNTDPEQDEQTEIPDKALWINRYFGSEVLNSFDKVSQSWNPLFKGFYHPADVFTKPDNPAHGQLWIDFTQNNLLHYYDKNTTTWIPVSAIQANDLGNTSAFSNFIMINPFIPNMTDSEGKSIYLVPNEKMGRFFDGAKYIHPNCANYTTESPISIKYEQGDLDDTETWVHVNSVNLNNIVKRIIKVSTDEANDNQAYCIDLSDHNTEFYGIDIMTGLGTLLRYDPKDESKSDYVKTDKGIKLTTREYQYVYAISYSFGSYVNYPGRLVRNSGEVLTQDNIFIGPSNKRVFVFLDGLYLEQDKYTYNKQTHSVELRNEDITELMDMVALTVPDYSQVHPDDPYKDDPLEFTLQYVVDDDLIDPAPTNIVSEKAKCGFVWCSDDNGGKFVNLSKERADLELEMNDGLVGPLTNASSFVNPMAFITGVHGHCNEPKEVEIVNDFAIIKNIGPVENGDVIKVMLVEAGDMVVSRGNVDNTLRIYDEKINPKDNYFLFVEGILTSPRDLDKAQGSIGAMGLREGLRYLLLKSTAEIDSELMFDSPVSYFTAKIEDDNANTVYNDCDTAVVYVDGGTLVDLNGITKDKIPTDGIKGEIIRVENPKSDEYTTIEYWNWDEETKKWTEIEDFEQLKVVDFICNGFLTNKGSISFLNKKCEGKPYTYYAYTLLNSIDEPLLYGTRNTQISKRDYLPNFKHLFKENTGSITAFLNGLSLQVQEPGNQILLLPELKNLNMIDKHGEDHTAEFPGLVDPLDNAKFSYIVERQEGAEDVSCIRQVLTVEDRLEGVINAYKTRMPLRPGMVTVYVNGVRLPINQYGIVSDNVVSIYGDLVGGQSIVDLADETTYKNYAISTSEGVKILQCEQSDELIVEVRYDYKVKELTIPIRYPGQNAFSREDDGIPESLINTKDFLKIYINGIFYGDEYEIDKEKGYVVLNNSYLVQHLGIDPIDLYFKTNPNEHDKYIEEHGKPYYPEQPKDYITFEWR